MRVLVACEFSGVVREAFRKAGHEAYSCDILPAADGSKHHFQEDVLKLLRRRGLPKWDLMIAHPPCTYLCNSGVRWLYDGDRFNEERWAAMQKGAAFFLSLLGAKVPRIAVENPVMHGHAKAIIAQEFGQSVQPWQFGHGEVKRTCFWLKNLPPLKPTNIVPGREARVHKMSPGENRGLLRSITYQGIADAMAAQWGVLE